MKERGRVTGLFLSLSPARDSKITLLFIFCLLVSKAYCLDFSIPGMELGAAFKPEYNRSLGFCWDISAFGSLKLNKLAAVKGGLALGMTGPGFDIDTYISGEVDMPFWSPLSFGLSYIYNGLPGYKTNVHTLLPAFSIKGKWAGITVGPALRFTGFDSAVFFEYTLAASAFANFYNTEKLRIGIRAANFNDFSAGNFGSYSLNLNSLVRFEQISLINEIELYQSGSSGLTSNFYGIAYKGGILFTW
ncbi:hypothetical protein AGMMS49991_01820 [Spirochaetia bacterium]|nr:hypothetical protein AGMMS49991_01820 [Spirochaetia bacterium]